MTGLLAEPKTASLCTTKPALLMIKIAVLWTEDYHYCGRSGAMELLIGAGAGGWVNSYTSVGLMMSDTDYNYSTGSGSADGSLTENRLSFSYRYFWRIHCWK